MEQPTEPGKQVLVALEPPPVHCYQFYEEYDCGHMAFEYDQQFPCPTSLDTGECDCTDWTLTALELTVKGSCIHCENGTSRKLKKAQREAEREDHSPGSTMSSAESNERTKKKKIPEFREEDD